MAFRTAFFRSFTEAEPLWRGIQARGICYGFQDYDWLATWQDTIGKRQGVQPVIVAINDQSGNAGMILPLGLYRRYGLTFLSFLGGDVTDYHAPLLSRDFATRLTPDSFLSVWATIVENAGSIDVVWLEKMPEKVEGIANPLLSLPRSVPSKPAYAAHLTGSFESFKASRSTKLFSDTRRRKRRLAEIGMLSYAVAENTETAKAIMAVLARQKSRRWRETGEIDLFANPAYREFYETITVDGLATGFAHVSALRFNSDVIATHFGMVYNKRIYSLLPAYEAGVWAKYSPGRILLEELLQWGFRQGIEILDFTGGDEKYKLQWSDESMMLYEHMCPLTAKGTCFVGYRGLRRIAARSPRLRRVFRLLGRRRPLLSVR